MSTAMTPWIWPASPYNPPSWVDPITEACEAGGSSCFTTGIDPGFANDLFPLTLMGLCSEVRSVAARELLDYTNYEGDYENEMGIGFPPERTSILESPEILILSWGATVPLIAHAAGVEFDDITDDMGEMGDGHPDRDRQGHGRTGHGRCDPFHHQRHARRAVDGSRSSTSTGWAGLGAGVAPREPGRRLSGGGRRKPFDHAGDRVSVHRRYPGVTQQQPDASPRGCVRSTRYPAVNDLAPGWVTPLDLRLIAGHGTIR